MTTPATCEEAGIRTYTAKITFEGKDFSDAKTEKLELLGHAYGVPVWKWSDDFTATATFTCANDESHVKTLDAAITSEVTTPATCEEAGVRTYTAKITFEGKDFSDAKTEKLEPLGHQPERRNVREASCTESGYTGDTICRVCEKILERGKQADALGHKFKNGKCSHCGKAAPAAPTTGDSVNLIGLWSVLAGAAVAAVSLTLILKKKQRNEE